MFSLSNISTIQYLVIRLQENKEMLHFIRFVYLTNEIYNPADSGMVIH